MNRLNYEILEGIDAINDAELESGIKVLESVIRAYEKADMILENASESADLSSYDIFQESVLFQEEDNIIDVDAVEVSDADMAGVKRIKTSVKAEKESKWRKINKKTGKKESIIKSILLAIPRAIMMFVKWLKNKFGNSKMKQMQKDMEKLQKIIDEQGGKLQSLQSENINIRTDILKNEAKHRLNNIQQSFQQRKDNVERMGDLEIAKKEALVNHLDNMIEIEKLRKSVMNDELDIAEMKDEVKPKLSKIDDAINDIIKLQLEQLRKDGNLVIQYDPEKLFELIDKLLYNINDLCKNQDILKGIKSSNFDDLYLEIHANAQNRQITRRIISIKDFTEFIDKTYSLANEFSKAADTLADKTKAAMRYAVGKGELTEDDEKQLKKKMHEITDCMRMLSEYFDKNYNFYFAGWQVACDVNLRESTRQIRNKFGAGNYLDAQVERKYYNKDGQGKNKKDSE